MNTRIDNRILIKLSWLIQQVGLDFGSNYLQVLGMTDKGEYIVRPQSSIPKTINVPESAVWG